MAVVVVARRHGALRAHTRTATHAHTHTHTALCLARMDGRLEWAQEASQGTLAKARPRRAAMAAQPQPEPSLSSWLLGSRVCRMGRELHRSKIANTGLLMDRTARAAGWRMEGSLD